jgi:hypothetical protein
MSLIVIGSKKELLGLYKNENVDYKLPAYFVDLN